MLEYTQGAAVTRNAAEKKVNSVLDFVSQSTDTQLLQVGAGRGGGLALFKSRALPGLSAVGGAEELAYSTWCGRVAAAAGACCDWGRCLCGHRESEKELSPASVPASPPRSPHPACTRPRPTAAQDFYSLTLDSLAQAKNERLWFKTNMKLAHLYVGLKELGRAGRVLKELHRWVSGPTGGPGGWANGR